MKKMIIIFGCILLGCYIFNLLLGSDVSSFKNLQKQVMEQETQSYYVSP